MDGNHTPQQQLEQSRESPAPDNTNTNISHGSNPVVLPPPSPSANQLSSPHLSPLRPPLSTSSVPPPSPPVKQGTSEVTTQSSVADSAAAELYSNGFADNESRFGSSGWSPLLSPRFGLGSDIPQESEETQDQAQSLQQEAPAQTPGSNKRKRLYAIEKSPSQSPAPESAAATTTGSQQPPKKRGRPKSATTTKARTSSIASGGGSAGGEGETENADSMSSAERPRLTEQEKKSNHIASEQKRRMAIREGFDRLTEIVPGLEGQGRSESIVLRKSVDHMREVLQERQELIERIQALGGEIPPDLQ